MPISPSDSHHLPLSSTFESPDLQICSQTEWPLRKPPTETREEWSADTGVNLEQSLAPHLWAYLLQIIGTIPLMPNPGPASQAASGTQGLQVQSITPQLLTNAQGQIIATVIGNQILPVINTQGITLSPIKPGQQVKAPCPGSKATWTPLLITLFLFVLDQWKVTFRL